MPRGQDPTWEDGIRNLRREEFDSLADLLHAVFRPTLVEEYPHFYTDENAGDMLVVVEEGRVVSHMGNLRRHVSLFGCTVRAACLGGVATLEAYRGRGHATALLERSLAFCHEDGVDFMLVSGYRKMYHRAGCRRVGRDWQFLLPADRAADFQDEGVSLDLAEVDDAPAMAEVYRREPVRWLRPPDDFRNALIGRVMNRPARTFLFRERDRLQAYAIVQDQAEEGDAVQILEFAGDRKALVGGLGELLRCCDTAALSLHVQGWDRLFHGLLTDRGLEGRAANSSGTVTVIDFVQLMTRMRPYFEEIVGKVAADSLAFRQLGDEMTVSYGGDEVVVCGPGAAAQLIFGTLDGAEQGMLKSGGKAGEVLAEVLPIPALWYGPNYL